MHRPLPSLGSHPSPHPPPRSRGRSRRRWTRRLAWRVTPTSATAHCCPTWRPPSVKCCASGPCLPCSSRTCPLPTPGETPWGAAGAEQRLREGAIISLCVCLAALGNTPSPRVPGSSSTSGLCTTMRRSGTSLRSSTLVGWVLSVFPRGQGERLSLGGAWWWEGASWCLLAGAGSRHCLLLQLGGGAHV